MNDDIADRAYELTPGAGSFYGDRLVRCRLKLKGWGGSFFNCVLVDCTFDPPLVSPNGAMLRDWMVRLNGTVVTTTHPVTFTAAPQ